ncbi:hypothetical protein CY34DRAFT_797975 [Suillus luteus UH-Slu-Lm8-n1]|uniref:Uncharacterized protein n=1 Tax=Suillus luteus UH-Slu-Lm8-n1 TaxID=930992 RepID=A0A0D0AE69_9AGAM|nr:hypothetical protein CY34DRAFT_797975 [Suillus luteus UH-Slu-Lm8-n1]
MSQKVYQPLHTDDPSSKIPPGEKDNRSQNHFQEISSCDTQEELIVCLERIRDLIKDNLANDELIDDPAEVVLDRLAVSLDWMLITAVVFMIMGMSYLRSPAYAAVGDAKTHELYLKLAEITSDTAMNDVFLALLAQSSQSHRYSYSRRLVQASILSSFLFAFLATLGKLVMGRNGFYLNMISRRKSRRKFFLRPLPSSRWFIPVLSRLPNAFLLNQLLLGIAFVVAHHLAL